MAKADKCMCQKYLALSGQARPIFIWAETISPILHKLNLQYQFSSLRAPRLKVRPRKEKTSYKITQMAICWKAKMCKWKAVKYREICI